MGQWQHVRLPVSLPHTVKPQDIKPMLPPTYVLGAASSRRGCFGAPVTLLAMGGSLETSL